MQAAEGRKEDKECERVVIAMTHAVVDPWTVVVHLHHAPDNEEKKGLKYIKSI